MKIKQSFHKCKNKSLEIWVSMFQNLRLGLVTELLLSCYGREELTGGNSDEFVGLRITFMSSKITYKIDGIAS